jgi:hypothetical protein
MNIKIPEKFQTTTRQTPYMTKTGIQIGLMYQPKLEYVPDHDMEKLQACLLNSQPRFRWDVALYLLFMAFVLAISVYRHFGGEE